MCCLMTAAASAKSLDKLIDQLGKNEKVLCANVKDLIKSEIAAEQVKVVLNSNENAKLFLKFMDELDRFDIYVLVKLDDSEKAEIEKDINNLKHFEPLTMISTNAQNVKVLGEQDKKIKDKVVLKEVLIYVSGKGLIRMSGNIDPLDLQKWQNTGDTIDSHLNIFNTNIDKISNSTEK